MASALGLPGADRLSKVGNHAILVFLEVEKLPKIYTRREAEGKRLKFRIFAGMFDFLGTIGSVIVIFACVLLLTALTTWIINDGKTTFESIFYSIRTAIIMPEATPLP